MYLTYRPSSSGKPGYPEVHSLRVHPWYAHFAGIFEIDPVETTQNKKGDTVPSARGSHRYRGPLVVDLDINEELPTLPHVWQEARRIIDVLQSHDAPYRVWFSGVKGYHIEIDQMTVTGGREFVPRLPAIYKDMVRSLGWRADMSRYCLGQGPSLRLPNRRRIVEGSATGPIKYQLDWPGFAAGPDQHRAWAEYEQWPEWAVPARPTDFLLRAFEQAKSRPQPVHSAPLDLSKKSATPACVKLLLEGAGAGNFHLKALKIASYGPPLHEVEPWLETTDSRSYPTSDERMAHYEALQSQNLDFSCGAMRASVGDAFCPVCPLRSKEDIPLQVLGPESPFRGHAVVGDSIFRLSRDRDKNVVYTYVGPWLMPLGRGVDGQGRTTGTLRLGAGEGGASLLVKAKDLITEGKLNGVATQLIRGPVAFSTARDSFAGIPYMLNLAACRSNMFRDVGASGLTVYKGRRYWVDSSGEVVDRDLQPSPNVALSSQGGLAPLVNLIPVEARNLQPDEWRLISQLHTPRLLYPSLAWVAASYFKPLLKPENGWPLLMIAGTAGTGKTTLVELLLKPLSGYLSQGSLQIPAMTEYTLRSEVTGSTRMCVFLDELKSTLTAAEGAGPGALKTPQILSLIRAAWDHADMYRGNHGGDASVYELTSCIAFMGPVVPMYMDEAALERLAVLSAAPFASPTFEQFKHWPGREEALLRFGKTLMLCAMRWPEEVVSALYARAQSMLSHLQLLPRPRRSLEVLMFGTLVLQKLLPEFNLQEACSAVIGITENQSGRSVDGGDDDFWILMNNILNLARPGAHYAPFHKIGEAGLVLDPAARILWLEAEAALQKSAAAMRQPQHITASALADMANSRGVLKSTTRALTIRGSKISGHWVGIDAGALSQRDIALEFVCTM